jgi:hypothetical protein
MSRSFIIKPRINKSNGQINISLPKKKIPKSLAEDIENLKCDKLKIILEDWS